MTEITSPPLTGRKAGPAAAAHRRALRCLLAGCHVDVVAGVRSRARAEGLRVECGQRLWRRWRRWRGGRGEVVAGDGLVEAGDEGGEHVQVVVAPAGQQPGHELAAA